VEELYERSLQVSAYWLRAAHPPAASRQAVAVLLDGIADGSLRVPPLTVVPLAEAAEAHRGLETRRTQGKLLLRVS
jgi:NADPH:quinone reductase